MEFSGGMMSAQECRTRRQSENRATTRVAPKVRGVSEPRFDRVVIAVFRMELSFDFPSADLSCDRAFMNMQFVFGHDRRCELGIAAVFMFDDGQMLVQDA